MYINIQIYFLNSLQYVDVVLRDKYTNLELFGAAEFSPALYADYFSVIVSGRIPAERDPFKILKTFDRSVWLLFLLSITVCSTISWLFNKLLTGKELTGKDFLASLTSFGGTFIKSEYKL